MIVSSTSTLPRAMDLSGAGLLVPRLQPEPLPIRAVKPSPCTQACPAGINVKAYVSLIAEERFAEALEVVRRRCPLPGICGRVCNHPCEAACRRGRYDDPIAIRALKRFVADLEREFPRPEPPEGPDRTEKVAVIGSGPAGLAAAYDLRLAGFPVTVYEAESEPGGMLRYGITAYRLPRDVISAEIDVLVRAGVEIKTGRRLGVDLELGRLLAEEYKAVLLAVGAQKGRHLSIPGENECGQIEDALAFLRRANDGDRTCPGKRVVVVGGGSTAVEAARTAMRLGAKKVEIVYRRYRQELLAGEEEIHAAELEGIAFRFLVTPSRVLVSGNRIQGLECVRVGLGEPDASGRRRPIRIPQSEFLVETDRVLVAVGQEADLGFLSPEETESLANGGRIAVDEATCSTSRPGVFAAGDVVTGPATIIEAIGAGHRAAETIRHYIEEGAPDIREEHPEQRAPAEFEVEEGPPIKARRIHPAFDLPQAGKEFAEVEKPFTPEEAVAEARRCVRCGPCGECRVCAPSCQRRHIMVRSERSNGENASSVLLRAPAGVAMALDTARPASGWLLPVIRPGVLTRMDTVESTPVKVLPVRTYIREERCRGCALCEEVCPFKAVKMMNGEVGPEMARIEAALCRGCNLCTSVCPSRAATASALSPEWWGTRMEDAFPPAPGRNPAANPYIVLACQRRAGALEATLDREGAHVEVIRFRCVGQIDAGMLLDLYGHGADGILVAGCLTDRCRFQTGSRLAATQVEHAQEILRLMGGDVDKIRCDWSAGRAHDPLEEALEGLIHVAPREPVAAGGR